MQTSKVPLVNKRQIEVQTNTYRSLRPITPPPLRQYPGSFSPVRCFHIIPVAFTGTKYAAAAAGGGGGAAGGGAGSGSRSRWGQKAPKKGAASKDAKRAAALFAAGKVEESAGLGHAVAMGVMSERFYFGGDG